MNPLKYFILFLAAFSIIKLIILVFALRKIKVPEMTEQEKKLYDEEADRKFIGED